MPGRKLTVSVAMATYNGAAHLSEQLDSIAAQSQPPLELIVSDDLSSDETLEIVARFKTQVSFAVRVIRNRSRLGFAENFLQAGRVCSGDLVAWCDQDDVWLPSKLERCTAVFERDPTIRLVVHSRQIGVVPTGKPEIRGGPFDAASQRVAGYTAGTAPHWFSAPGMASVVDRRVLAVADSVRASLSGDFGEYGHDTWSAFVAAAMGTIVFVPDVLSFYRIHDANTLGVPPPLSRLTRARSSVARDRLTFCTELERQAARAAFRADLLAQLQARPDVPGARRAAAAWKREEAILRRRRRLYDSRSSRSQAVRHLVGNARRGDYGGRVDGGLGAASLLRDMYRSVRG